MHLVTNLASAQHDEMASLKAQLLDRLRPFKQDGVLRFWEELTPAQQTALAADVSQIDLQLIADLHLNSAHLTNLHDHISQAFPPEAFRLGRQNSISQATAKQVGEEALTRGQIGAVLVAGGQGTRLGFEHPKGMYPIGPVSHASLFQILFEKIVALRERYTRSFPLFVMTSPATHEKTLEFLAQHDRFGLSTDDLLVHSQGTMPSIDQESGQLLLESRLQLSQSPDGHGGLLGAMSHANAFEQFQARGIKQLFYFQVDNPLVRIGDPEFIGYHLISQAQISTLAIAKQTALDRVGNLVTIDGRQQIIEYSEFNHLPESLIGSRDGQGQLRFWAGNTAIHLFDVNFLRDMSAGRGQLPFHVAHKRVAHVGEQGEWIEPEKPNALKFERFIFDLLPAAQKAIVVETNLRETFAPLKNPPGDPTDSPEAVRAQMIALHTAWLKQAGAQVKPGVPVEISPRFALDEIQLEQKIRRGQLIDEPTYFS